MLLTISDETYPGALDRFDELWVVPEPSTETLEELDVLADLISAFEDRRYSYVNSPTYRDLLNEKLKRQNGKV